MLFDGLAEIFAPMQIAMVIIIALVVFGPQKLPEIAKQMGTAIRDLKKAGSDMMSSFNTDHEPDYEPYPNNNYSNGYNNGYSSGYSSSYNGYSYPGEVGAPVDLTDYTIVGKYVPEPPKMPQVDLSDYAIAPSAPKQQEPADSSSSSAS